MRVQIMYGTLKDYFRNHPYRTIGRQHGTKRRLNEVILTVDHTEILLLVAYRDQPVYPLLCHDIHYERGTTLVTAVVGNSPVRALHLPSPRMLQASGSPEYVNSFKKKSLAQNTRRTNQRQISIEMASLSFVASSASAARPISTSARLSSRSVTTRRSRSHSRVQEPW